MQPVTASTSVGTDLAALPSATSGRSVQAAPGQFEKFLATSTVSEESTGPVVRSVTVNSTMSDRVAQNQSPLSEPPTSVARVIRESYGRTISARSRRFNAHA